ncbi:TPA: restriction endonuclease subunit S [Pasteurella multocida]|nr:restriction endonuclease subunit S [Pasteurella multocida]
MNTLPNGWERKKISESYRILNNLRKPISEEIRELNKGDYPYYGSTKIQSYINTYEQDGEFVLIGEDGDHFLKHSTHKMTQLISGKCTVNNHAHVIASTDIASIEWFYYYFMHKDITKYLTRQGAGRFKLTKVALEKIPILLPPLSEQTKIAEILSTWDKAIQTTEQLLANSQQQKKALMQQLLTGKKRLKGFSGEWRKTRLINLLKEEKARNRDNQVTRVLSVTNHSGFVLPEDQFSKRVASEDISNYKIVKKGQFAYNPSRLNVGSFARLDKFGDSTLSPMYVVFSIKSKELNSDFFLYWMQSHEAKQRINNSTQGSVRESVGFDALCSFPFALPSLSEQQKIAQILSTQDQEIDTLQQKLTCLKQEKKALMQKLLSGKVRV